MVFYTFLAFEAFVITLDTFWTMQSGSITVRRRNNRVMADVVLEVLSSTIPLIIMRFGYNFEFMDISEFNKVALVPACFAITKITKSRKLFSENARFNTVARRREPNDCLSSHNGTNRLLFWRKQTRIRQWHKNKCDIRQDGCMSVLACYPFCMDCFC